MNEDANKTGGQGADHHPSARLNKESPKHVSRRDTKKANHKREEVINNPYSTPLPAPEHPESKKGKNGMEEVIEGETSTATYLKIAFVLLILGILLLNQHYIYMSLIPLVFTLICIAFDTPSQVEVRKELSKTECHIDDTITVKIRLRVGNGLGIVILRDIVPEHFELTQGSNVRAFFKGLKPLETTITYTVKCSLKGIYETPPTEIETIHVLGFKKNKYYKFSYPGKVTVLPLVFPIRRIRMPPTKSSMLVPLTAISRKGPITTEFREIRRYVYGDPVKYINWKATARTGSKIPLVNEYERESKKTVIIFLDTTTNMRYGTTLKNPLEYGISAVASLSYYLLNRSFNVGIVVYGNEAMIAPRTGGDQYYRILRTLINLKTFSDKTTLEKSIVLNKRWIIECTPLIFIITNITRHNIHDLTTGVKRATLYLGRSIERTRRAPIIILDVSPLHISTSIYRHGKLVAEIADLEKTSLYKHLKNLGATIVKWEPGRKPLTAALTPLLRLIK